MRLKRIYGTRQALLFKSILLEGTQLSQCLWQTTEVGSSLFDFHKALGTLRGKPLDRCILPGWYLQWKTAASNQP